MSTASATIPFTKMHSAGNDYAYVDAFAGPVAARLARLDLGELARRLSDRHFGIGSDGLIVLEPAAVEGAACTMRMWNADGSRGAMCGNGLLCLAKLAHDLGRVTATEFTVATASGPRSVELRDGDARARRVRGDMGKVVVERTPLPIEALGRTWQVHRGDAGNPHAVVFVADVEAAPVAELGGLLQRHEAFPDGVNVELVQVLPDGSLAQRTFERGSGETLACGTGACAVALVALETRRAAGPAVRVRLRGGELQVTRRGAATMLEGTAVTVFHGELDP